jgi:hypothetical protein
LVEECVEIIEQFLDTGTWKSCNCCTAFESVDVILPPSIQIGSDEEKSLIKAVDTVFPDAKRSLCTKPLKDNVSVYVRNKIGISPLGSKLLKFSFSFG